MLVGNFTEAHVKFIDYDGEYPNLCKGTLTLEIDGIQYKISHQHYDNKTMFPKFWRSGGGVCPEYSGAYGGEWKIYIESIPKQFRKYAHEIDEMFNSNVLGMLRRMYMMTQYRFLQNLGFWQQYQDSFLEDYFSISLSWYQKIILRMGAFHLDM